jgi:hypothetical protein
MNGVIDTATAPPPTAHSITKPAARFSACAGTKTAYSCAKRALDRPRYDLSSPATVPVSIGKLCIEDSNAAVSKNELPLAATAMIAEA